MLLKFLIIFLFIFLFFYLRSLLKLNKEQKVLKHKKFIIFNKKNLNNWMNLTKKERYNLLKKDSLINQAMGIKKRLYLLRMILN